MDDRTAYRILKIRAGTRQEDLSRRHDCFVKLYKRYLMGQPIPMSPEEIEQIKKAYEHLLYRRIEEEELKDLYPQERTDLGYKMWKSGVKVAAPFLNRHRGKVIYTLVMCVLTYVIIFIRTYQPIDLRIAVLSKPSESVFEFEIKSQCAQIFEDILIDNLPELKRPKIEFEGYYMMDSLPDLRISDKYDVYIMEESFLQALQSTGVTFLTLDPYLSPELDAAYNPIIQNGPSVSEVYIGKDTSLYQHLCNLYNDNQTWVAVVYPDSPHQEQALEFVKYLNRYEIKK